MIIAGFIDFKSLFNVHENTCHWGLLQVFNGDFGGLGKIYLLIYNPAKFMLLYTILSPLASGLDATI